MTEGLPVVPLVELALGWIVQKGPPACLRNTLEDCRHVLL